MFINVSGILLLPPGFTFLLILSFSNSFCKGGKFSVSENFFVPFFLSKYNFPGYGIQSSNYTGIFLQHIKALIHYLCVPKAANKKSDVT